MQELFVGVVVVVDDHLELIGFRVVRVDVERQQVVNNDVGTGSSDLLRVVGGADTDDEGARTLTGRDAGGGIFKHHNLVVASFVTKSVSGVLVAHGVGLTLSDLFGGDKHVRLFDGQKLQPLGGQRQGTRGDDGPSLLTVFSGVSRQVVELLDELDGTGDGLGVLAERVGNRTLPLGHLFHFGVFRRPLGDDIESSAPVRGSDDFFRVDVGSGLAKVSPEFRDGPGRVDEGPVAVEQSGVNVKDGGLLGDSHG